MVRSRRYLDVITPAVVVLWALAMHAWVPLGIIGGLARTAPAWSECGGALCTCAPVAACPLCEIAEGDVCDGECKETRVVMRDVEEARGKMLGLLMFGAGFAPVSSHPTVGAPERENGRVLGHAVAGAWRVIATDTPPPRA